MAAACNVSTDEASAAINNDLLEAQIVAQAITELQEIQAPGVQHVSSGESQIVSVITESGLTSEPVDTNNLAPTQVIYYIEDGSVARTEDRVLVDSSVQANDFEIERRSGRVPSRKRVIPVKFRDYKHNSDQDTSDSDYDPNEYRPRAKKVRAPRPGGDSHYTQRVRRVDSTGKTLKAGRPRKNFMPTHTAKGNAISIPTVVTSMELEQKYQDAIRISHQHEADAGNKQQQEAGSQQQEAGTQPQEMDVEEVKTGTQPQEAELGEGGETEEGGLNPKQEPANDEDHDGVKEDGTGPTTSLPTLAPRPPPPAKRGRGRPRAPGWERFYKCPDCDKTFNQKGNLRVHLRVHTTERPFPCQEEGCSKSFRSNESLRRHLLSHQGIKPFECELCGNKFSSNVALTEHRSRHYDQRPHACPHCGKRFRQVSCLRRHVTTHSGELPFVCPVCQRAFVQTSYLKSHMKVHTGEKPFACGVCNKRFAHQSDVKRHRTTHTGEKPYSCSKCHTRFSDVSSKNRHEKEHENNKRYTCHLCSDTFKRTGQLRSHLNRKHSHTFPVKIEKDPGSGGFTFKVGEEGDPGTVHVTQHKLVSLIKNLHSKTVSASEGFTEIGNISVMYKPETVNQSEEGAMATEHVTDISQLEKEVDASVIESDMGVPIELQGVEIQGEEAGQTFIAIADLADSLAGGAEKSADDKPVECRYRIVCEIAEDGQQKQLLVPYNVDDDINPNLDIHVQYTQMEEDPSIQTVTESTVVTDTVANEDLLTVNTNQQPIVIQTQTAEEHQQAEVVSATETIVEAASLANAAEYVQDENADSEGARLEASVVNVNEQVEKTFETLVSVASGNDNIHTTVVDAASESYTAAVVEISESYNPVASESYNAAVATSQSLTAASGSYTVLGAPTSKSYNSAVAATSESYTAVVATTSESYTVPVASSSESYTVTEATTSESYTVTEATSSESYTVPVAAESESSAIYAPSGAQMAEDSDAAAMSNSANDKSQPSDMLGNTLTTNTTATMGGASLTSSGPSSSSVDYVTNPDFSSQDYYNWLTNFTELCKVVPMPLDMSLFQKISQVHKTLSDVMATPSGVIADRENFRVLMNISKELSTIINEHLVYVLENLNEAGKGKEAVESMEITNL